MQKKVLIPLPSKDFDPTEVAIPWKILNDGQVKVVFATPTGNEAVCDQHMLTGSRLGPLAPLLAADKNALKAYQELTQAEEFHHPIKWDEISPDQFQGLLLPGGHAQGMKEYLESSLLQKTVSHFFEMNKPVGAICHGVVLAARSQRQDGRSVLYGRKTTALLASQEMAAWVLTCTWMGNYYRTYPQTVESEVTAALETREHFLKGPTPLFRDSSSHLGRGFVVQDGNYLSARWPGDAHQFATAFLKMIKYQPDL